MKKVDRKTELLKKLQEELDKRTRIEEEAINLISQCEFDKAQELLKTMDDSLVKELQKELDELDQEPEETEPEADLKAACEHVGEIITDFLLDLMEDLVIEAQKPVHESSDSVYERCKRYAAGLRKREEGGQAP